MNTTELVNILRTDQHTRVLNPAVKPLNHFLEEPLNRPSMTIVNLDSCDERGSHWVAFIFHCMVIRNTLIHMEINPMDYFS